MAGGGKSKSEEEANKSSFVAPLGGFKASSKRKKTVHYVASGSVSWAAPTTS